MTRDSERITSIVSAHHNPKVQTHFSQGPAVLVTGGAGFIGSSLCVALEGLGARVVAFDDLSTGRLENVAALRASGRFHFEQGSVLDADRVEQLVRASDLVFHLAAMVGVNRILEFPERTLEINVEGTRNVLAAAARWHKPLLLTSTSEVYGVDQSVPLREDSVTSAGSPDDEPARLAYAQSKRACEEMALAHHRAGNCQVVITRLFNTIGPAQLSHYGMVVPRFVSRALDGRPLEVYGDGRQTRSFMGVQDAVAALLALASEPKAAGEIVNIGSTHEIEIESLARLVLRLAAPLADPGERVVRLDYLSAYGVPYVDTKRRVPCTENLRRLIGWQPTRELGELLEEIIDVHRSAAH